MQQEILAILSSSLFRAISSNRKIQVHQLCAAISLLTKAGIPFDLSYSPGTPRIAAQAQLTIYVKPRVSINLTIAFETGDILLNGL
jgi:hypothetical protein